MGSSLIILNADFSENAIPVWLKMLVKKGTAVSIPVREGADGSDIIFYIEADATNADEDTYFELEIPNAYKNTTFNYTLGLFSPNYNPSAANIKELYIDVSNLGTAGYLCLQNNTLEKITILSRKPSALGFSSGFQSLNNLKYFDCSKFQAGGQDTSFYPLMCPKVEEANLSFDWKTTPSITMIDYLGNNCYDLKVLHMNGWRFANNCTYANAFMNCLKLEKIYIDDADAAAFLISVLTSVSSAKVDSSRTAYDATNGVINVVHTS